MWQTYTEKKHPSSRDLDSVMSGHDMNIHATSTQLSFFFSNFGCLLRQPGMGNRKTTWLSTTHPEAPRMSQIVQLWARNWGHIRATCETSCLTWQVCRDYGIEICFGIKNPNLSVSVSSPPDVATFQILEERDDPCCPWSAFQINVGDIKHLPSVLLMGT